MPTSAVLLAVLLGAAPAAPAEEHAVSGAPAEIAIVPRVARPGDAVLVRVRRLAPDGEPAVGSTLAGRPLHFFPHGDESWAIGALPIETPPGPVSVEIREGDSRRERRSATLEVVEANFPSRRLKVAAQFVTPPSSVQVRIKRDQAAFAAAYDRPFVPPLFTANFAWPHPGGLRARFGDQRVFNGKKESVHYGLDIDAPRGAPVRAANDGVVVLARDCYYSGKTVVVWHGADLFTLYFHMDRLQVRRGARVRQGDRVGVVGSTGRSTGPHLHWSARAAGLLVDPESLVGIDFALGAALPRRMGPPPREPGEEPPPAAEPPPEMSGTAAR
jgi:murein DD-endopeptidase MepM/ murein hydrolase activator NlpD